MSDRYLIWSHEHDAWWAPNRQGYTQDVAAAGRYSFEEAGRIVAMPCAPHLAMGLEQRTPTEVEHFVHKSHGGYDRGDTYPTCGECRELRHVTMGPKAFTRMLLRFGLDERALCNRLKAQYEAEVWPCP